MKFAEKNMKKLGRNFTMNLTKSFTRMRKHISKTDSDTTGKALMLSQYLRKSQHSADQSQSTNNAVIYVKTGLTPPLCL